MNRLKSNNRREFLQKSLVLSASLSTSRLGCTMSNKPKITMPPKSIYLLGPREGYDLHIGSVLSTMTMMRAWVINTVQDLTVKQLDFHLDDQSNSIGAMLFHLAATERYYQLNTFEGLAWGTWSDDIKSEWDVAMGLGETARNKIKGHNFDFYKSKLEEVRENTKKEFAKRDDNWFMESENFFGNEATNNYCKWFHVCEHESNHNGQMKFIKKRLPA